MVNTLKLPVGIDSFEKIRKNRFYYIDKTKLIEQLVETGGEVTLFTRPRRFGKTLNMSMLRSFFEIDADESLFDGLYITKNKELCEEYMGKYPVIFLSLKSVDGLTFEDAKYRMTELIGLEAERFGFLEDSEHLSENEKKRYKAIISLNNGMNTMNEKMLISSLQVLSQLLYKHFGKKVIILIDEYDVPLDKAFQNGFYREMVLLIRGLFGMALKTNDSLQFAVLTGCMRISKESIFTGLNNFEVLSILNDQYDESFGFTDAEVKKILNDYNLKDHYLEVKEWYDGYHFGEFDMYCPWDVLNYVYDLQEHEEISQPVSYWRNTSDNAVIRSFLDHKQNLITAKLEILLGGGYIIQKIDENLTYDFDRCSDENFWSVLYLTGYLTRCREKDLRPEDRNRIRDGFTALMIPNEEIQEIYRDTIVKWFMESAPSWKPENLGEAIQKEA